jgi:hypothetical protein
MDPQQSQSPFLTKAVVEAFGVSPLRSRRAAFISLKPPAQDLDYLYLMIKGDCETVAQHASNWWPKECPTVLSDVHIEELQEMSNQTLQLGALVVLDQI